MSTIEQRFGVERTVGGDPLGAWTAGVEAVLEQTPAVRVHGIDLAHASRPRAIRALAHQRLTMLQLALLRDTAARRVLVVVRLALDCDESRVCRGLGAAVDSVHSRVERAQGRPFAIAALAVPRDTSPRRVWQCIVEGAPIVPDGATAVTWRDADEWGLRAAIQNQSL
ncbi:hypothetical protein HDC37_003008 [Microbacterium sp. AK009]|uniref:hypothetical protein n=1 Tax=Microbacterium sp. AK009 TaxID=2723068 RepID=UPI0015CBA8F6|nr:hypothetical protein [Microbacterium sp. AK009]NYF18152.1 hypothetical protein [Microbacterium sp. AK009]